MTLLCRIKLIFQFLGYVILNLFNAIMILLLYIALIPFCIASRKILSQTTNHVLKLTFRESKNDLDALYLMEELLKDYRATVMAWTYTDIDIFDNPEERWAVNETIKYLEKNGRKINLKGE